MPAPHPSPEPDQPDRQQAEDAQYYRRVLHGLIEIGSNLARLVNQQAEEAAAGADPAQSAVLASAAAPDATVAFERIARTIRRTIILARQVAEPLPERRVSHDAGQARQRTEARKHIIRAVEDTIEEKVGSHERAESLHAELLERLDGPDVDDSLVDRPIGEIIAEIQRDLGLHAIAGMRLWKRRTPADIAVLCARAAAPSVRPAWAGTVRQRPGGGTGSGSPAGMADAEVATLHHAACPADP